MRESWDFQEGAVIAPGRAVLKPLGGGSAYEVFLVWDELLHAICVAKVLRPDRAEESRSIEDLLEEAAILERLSHPMVVRMFDAVLDGEHPHLLIEHLEGPSLRRLIKRGGALPIQQVVPLALSLAGALHYLERMEIVHLDVKPDNLIMGVPPRLIDLSVACAFEQTHRIRRPVGTDAYMSPEQCNPLGGWGPIGPASDIWGLGATLHHALSGERPFPRPKGASESPDPQIRFPQLFEAARPLPSHLPDGLIELVHSTLEPDPADRPSGTELAAALEPFVAELPEKMSLRRGAKVW